MMIKQLRSSTPNCGDSRCHIPFRMWCILSVALAPQACVPIRGRYSVGGRLGGGGIAHGRPADRTGVRFAEISSIPFSPSGASALSS